MQRCHVSVNRKNVGFVIFVAFPIFIHILPMFWMIAGCYAILHSNLFDYMADFILDAQIFLYPKSVYCLVFPFVLVSNISLLLNLLYQRIFT